MKRGMEMNEAVYKKLCEIVDVFNCFSACKIDPNCGERLLIASYKPVPWAKCLKKQYGESDYKIGYIDPKKNALGLYIDFPKNSFKFEQVSEIINPNASLLYVSSEERAPSSISWWRFRTNDHFDSIHIVLRKDELLKYDVQEDSWIKLMHEIVDVHEK